VTFARVVMTFGVISRTVSRTFKTT